jgi:hypothetical protein
MNDNRQGKPKYSEKPRPSAIFPTKNPWDQTQATVLGSWGLNASAKVRPDRLFDRCL